MGLRNWVDEKTHASYTYFEDYNGFCINMLGCKVKKLVIPPFVSMIAGHAGVCKLEIEELYIPESVTYIANGELSYQSSLKRLYYYASTNPPEDLCMYCESLEEVWIGDKVTTLTSFDFAHCGKLQTVHLDSLDSIYLSSFCLSNTHSLTNLDFKHKECKVTLAKTAFRESKFDIHALTNPIGL